jgi:hypothetical protein
MKPVRDFGELRRRGTRQLYKIRGIAAWSVMSPYSREHDRNLAWVTIESLNLWSEFCRAYFLSCLRSAQLESGVQVVCKRNTGYSFEQAIGSILHSLNRRVPPAGKLTRRDEPTWHEPQSLITGCTNMDTSNLSQVQAALSIGSPVFTHLPTCRNFFAHRNDDTAMKVLTLGQSSYSMFSTHHPSEVLTRPAYGRPQSLILDFIDDLWATMELLCA